MVQAEYDLARLYERANDRTKQQLHQHILEAYVNKDIIFKALVRFIVDSRQPLSVVEKSSFHNLTKALCPIIDDL
jgi:hypothetical protein